ncbi:hypothetical protein CC80DRAFT_597169 [Byssothecium circinans]|uniref:Methyltransferase type 11 domain-containing protein n=1 Tax=Byssothecium circinans TaxID=147558 RepID=A0A6A5TRY5_9PLEO|nr:hypothetical protein CC80DRAFT_597169 [Byssothecium circinans]
MPPVSPLNCSTSPLLQGGCPQTDPTTATLLSPTVLRATQTSCDSCEDISSTTARSLLVSVSPASLRALPLSAITVNNHRHYGATDSSAPLKVDLTAFLQENPKTTSCHPQEPDNLELPRHHLNQLELSIADDTGHTIYQHTVSSGFFWRQTLTFHAISRPIGFASYLGHTRFPNMASYKSQLDPPRRVEDQAPYPNRTTTTRLPKRSITPTTTASQSPASGHSKLQKRKPRDEEVHGRKAATGQREGRSRHGLVSATPTVPKTHSNPAFSAPKPRLQIPSSRLPKLEVPRTTITPTPSLVSGSSVSTTDSPRSNVLRKKQSSIGVKSPIKEPRVREDSMSSQEEKSVEKGIPGMFKDPFSETVLGISLPPSSTMLARADPESEFSNHFHYNFNMGPIDTLPPAPLHTLSTTPSTHYSESPGPFSVSSTPTSISSYSHSPGVALPTKSMRMRQVSPLQSKPPVVRQNADSESAPTAAQVVETKMATTVRRPSQTPLEKPRAQAPPELAHLADSPVLPAARRPSRPSRDGTLEMIGLRGPSPVIQSNLTSFLSSHKRTPSTGSITGTTVNSKTRFGIPSKSSSRNPSPNPNLAPGSAPPSRVPTRGNTPDLEQQRSQTLPTATTAPGPSKSSRFGFFTRRTKTEPPAPAAKSEKKHRRGPAAGTGHEGYGRYAIRGRSGSTGSVTTSIGRSASAATTSESLDYTPSTRKSSVTSTSSTDMDGFFLDRLAPRVIRGTGSSTELTRSSEPMQSTSSLDVSSPSGKALKKIPTNASQSDLESTRPTLLPSAMSDPVRKMSPMKKQPPGLRRPSESEDEPKRSFIPSFASRRTSRISKATEATEVASKDPRNGTALGKVRKGSVDGHATDRKDLNPPKSSKREKSEKEISKPRKWNFFQRAHAVPRVATPAIKPTVASPPRVPGSRFVAHYALAPESGIDLEDIEQLMQEEDSSPEDASLPTEAALAGEPERKERLHSMLLPPKPILPSHLAAPARPASPKVFLRTDYEQSSSQPKLTIDTSRSQTNQSPDAHSQGDVTPVTDLSPCSSPSRPSSLAESLISPRTMPASAFFVSTTQALSMPPGPPPSHAPPKLSRLAQVGRIPQVVSRRAQGHQPSSRSFSRPFAADKPHPNVPPRTSFDYFGSLTATAGPVESFPVLQGLNALTHTDAIATISPSAEDANRQSEFFKFPPRKDSEVSYSSSSGVWSFPPTAGTAVMPVSGAPQSEDEVWNEYDDLIDEVLSPVDFNVGGSKEKAPRKRPSLEPLPLKIKASRVSSQSTGSAVDVANPSVHLRRSRLLSVLHAQSPTSPTSLSEFLQGYGERNISVIDPVTGRLSFPSTRLSTESALRNRPSSTRSSLPASLTLSARQSKATLASSSDKSRESTSTNKYRDTRLMEFAEAQADGLVSMANLRFGALMTSKWLSFGRVLFSPAHFEIKNPSEDRVLVVDGLGKDWSYYCALTYPEATIYNLGPEASPLAQSNSTAPEPWSTLTNHRHISHPSLSTAFPFPKGFFACVVLRFPSALPSSVHRFVLSECKRVLRPGGHLELSVLDLDLVNMGNRARRAVRGLKVKMQVADENISLRNISDEFMGILGRKGFTEFNRCFVGVPVAGHLPGPEETGTPDSRKRKGSSASSVSKTTSAASPPAKQPKPEVSFSELLNRQTSSESTDNGIADMVARVGRWWYSRCYESLVLPEAGEPDAANSGHLLETSIWRDEALIKECEKRGTSFKLLIGYAQKPDVGVRRTVSV